jgi:hypothetical protein
MGLPSSPRNTPLRSSFIGTKKICRWLASGLMRVTTPVKTRVCSMLKMEKEWCAKAGRAAAAPNSSVTTPTRPKRNVLFMSDLPTAKFVFSARAPS